MPLTNRPIGQYPHGFDDPEFIKTYTSNSTGGSTDMLLRELIDEIKGLRADLKYQDILSGKRMIGK